MRGKPHNLTQSIRRCIGGRAYILSLAILSTALFISLIFPPTHFQAFTVGAAVFDFGDERGWETLLPISEKSNEPQIERLTVPVVASLTIDQIVSSRGNDNRAAFRKRRAEMTAANHRSDLVNSDRTTSLPGGSRYPVSKSENGLDDSTGGSGQLAAQTVGLTFEGATGPTETGTFPPDMQAAVGPTQIVVFLNGLLRTFNKNTGVADGVVDVAPEVFFSSVMTPAGTGESVTAIYPHARYDRISNRWFLNIVDNSINDSTGEISHPNRILLAVSDAASNGSISMATVWTFYQFQGDATRYADHASFGVDASAIYIGANLYGLPASFDNTKAWVIPKAPALTGSSLTVWAIDNLLIGGSGPFAPAAVDNPDPGNIGSGAVGFFIGVDNASFGALSIRRITNPGSLGAAPSVSGNMSVAVNDTQFPLAVPHLGNLGGIDGMLDALDDRLSSAAIRNGRLWTTHNIGVNSSGTTSGILTRNAIRWYEIHNLNTTPTLIQSGTLFDDTGPNDGNQRNYWMPAVTVSGQGHAVLGCSVAGANERINAFVTGRLAGDPLGLIREGPGGASVSGYTNSTFAYNPTSDPGGPLGRRWGNYSMTVVDPMDDMTVWTIQQYANGADTFGVRVAKLIAPPPATPAAPVPVNVPIGVTSTNVTITGAALNGSGFFDPGSDLASPALPFNHISAALSGSDISINAVTFNSPTSVTLDLNTLNASPGLRNVTITNPDGQARTGNNIINANNTIAGGITYGTAPVAQGVRFVPGVLLSAAGTPGGSATSDVSGVFSVSGLGTGTYTLTPSKTGNINGITAGDATLVLRHVAAGGTVLTPNQQAAADVNVNGLVTAGDATLVLRYVAAGQQTPQTGQAGNWIFLPQNRSYSNLTSDLTGQDFVAVLLGEVSGNWIASGGFAGAGAEENLPEAPEVSTIEATVAETVTADSSKLQAAHSEQFALAGVGVSLPTSTAGNGTIVTIPVTLTNTSKAISSFSFAVFFNAAVLQPVGSGDAAGHSKVGTLSESCTIVGNATTPGRLGIGAGGCTTITGSGTILNLRFTVVGTAPASTTLTFGSVVFEDPDINTIPATATDGSFAVLPPTAASVSLAGRLTTLNGLGIGNAIVTLEGGNLTVPRTALTNPFGYYAFGELPAGLTYLVSVSSKRHVFANPSRVINLVEELTDVDFIGQPLP